MVVESTFELEFVCIAAVMHDRLQSSNMAAKWASFFLLPYKNEDSVSAILLLYLHTQYNVLHKYFFDLTTYQAT
jgi:hypothetical protein